MQMIVKATRWRVIAVTIIASLVGGISGLRADHPVDGGGSDWSGLESVLERVGVTTDTGSLVRAAKGSDDITARMFSVELLGRRREISALADLQEILAREEEPLMRQILALALARMGDAKGARMVEEMIRSETDQSRRVFLSKNLAELGDFAGYNEIVLAARSESPSIRELAPSGLVLSSIAGFKGDLLPKEDLPTELLLKLLGDSDPKVRQEAILQIAIGDRRGLVVERILPVIEGLVTGDPATEVRSEAHRFFLLR